MPEVTASSIVDVQLGTQMVGALMAGNREIYVRFVKYFFGTPGSFTFTLPDWASGYAVAMSGGGGGGRAGNGGNSNRGNGGQGGVVGGRLFRLTTNSSRLLSGVIGAGGAGGTSSHAYGQNGGTTSISYEAKTYSAAGGAGNPTMSTQAGGLKSLNIAQQYIRWYDVGADGKYPTGPAGSGNGGAGQRGGGGAGGNGGIFNNYTRGGKGGDGFVDILVWGMPPDEMTDRDTEQITLGPGWKARDQFRDMLVDRGLDYRTVTEIPFDIELVGTGTTNSMFQGCSALTSVPEMDTSNVTNMNSMFYGCSALTTAPEMDTSNVTNMGSMFQGCSALTSVPEMDTSNVTYMVSMFQVCSALTSVPDMDTSSVTNAAGMFYGCSSLTKAPSMNTSQVTMTSTMFYNCSALTSVPDMDTSNVTNMNSMFRNCSSLTDGNVRLIGKHPSVTTTQMIDGSGLTREPFYNAAGNPI